MIIFNKKIRLLIQGDGVIEWVYDMKALNVFY